MTNALQQSRANRNAPSFRSDPTKFTGRQSWDRTDTLFSIGMVALALQSTQIGIAQPGQLWLLAALVYIAHSKKLVISRFEVVVFGLFFFYACMLDVLTDFDRIKAAEQTFKFGFLYPGFYLVGRSFGRRYARSAVPLGFLFLVVLLALEIATQRLGIPLLYADVDFQKDVLHGTFKERNWLAVYFFLFSFFLFEKGSSEGRLQIQGVLLFVGINVLVMIASGSKTTFVGCGIALLARARIPVPAKILLIAIGGLAYWSVFSDDFSEARIRVRLEEERGLAFQQAIELIGQNLFGYGFGFVESYFSNLGLTIRGLGSGVNSIFSVPLDLLIIAGPLGLLCWLVFFCGLGIGCTTVLAPVAALSLLNPLHQSDLVYFFVGMLVSQSRYRRRPQRISPALRE